MLINNGGVLMALKMARLHSFCSQVFTVLVIPDLSGLKSLGTASDPPPPPPPEEEPQTSQKTFLVYLQLRAKSAGGGASCLN